MNAPKVEMKIDRFRDISWGTILIDNTKIIEGILEPLLSFFNDLVNDADYCRFVLNHTNASS